MVCVQLQGIPASELQVMMSVLLCDCRRHRLTRGMACWQAMKCHTVQCSLLVVNSGWHWQWRGLSAPSLSAICHCLLRTSSEWEQSTALASVATVVSSHSTLSLVSPPSLHLSHLWRALTLYAQLGLSAFSPPLTLVTILHALCSALSLYLLSICHTSDEPSRSTLSFVSLRLLSTSHTSDEPSRSTHNLVSK